MHPDEQYFKIVFCRVCGFRIWVWKSYRTCRSSGYGYGCFTELTEVPGGYAKIAPVSVPDGTRTPGCCCSHNNSSPRCRPWSQGRLQCLKRKNTSGGKKTKKNSPQGGKKANYAEIRSFFENCPVILISTL